MAHVKEQLASTIPGVPGETSDIDLADGFRTQSFHLMQAHPIAAAHHPGEPIAVPCGFRDRHNNPCHRLGNWPIMDGSKQMLCRGRPMVHCDAACFKGDPPAPGPDTIGEDVAWSDDAGEYDDDQ